MSTEHEALVAAIVAAFRTLLPELRDALREHDGPQRIYRPAEMQEVTGLKPTAVAEAVARGELKPPIKLSERAIGYLASDVAEWQRQRIAATLAEQSAKTKKARSPQ